MLTVTADSCDRHDTSAGACWCESNPVRLDHDVFGSNRSKDMNVIDFNRIEHDVVRKPVPTFRRHAPGHDTRFLQSCRENFVREVSRYGLTKRDIDPNVNFFMNVPIDPSGDLVIADGVSNPGDSIELVAAMDMLCVISNCPQVNNPCNGFDPTPVRVEIFPAASA